MLTVKNLQKSYQEKLILNNVSFTIRTGEKAGLVGDNGTGKTTLLKIIASLETPDQGHVQAGGPPSSIGYLKQEFSAEEETMTVADFVSSYSHLDLKEHYKIKIVMDGLDFPYRRWSNHIASLSGGQKSKLLLSVALLNASQLILLDEPTNNLDTEAILWLETYLLGLDTPMLIVSHDRSFLNHLATKILEIDENTLDIKEYSGNYDFYHATKELEKNQALAKYQKCQEKITKLEANIRMAKSWAAKGQRYIPHDNDKYIKGFKRDKAKKNARIAKNFEKRIEQLEKVAKPNEKAPLKMSFATTNLGGSRSIRLIDAVCGYKGGFQTAPISLECNFGHRIAIIGKNGTGKSTIIKTIAGKLTALSGRVLLGAGLKIGYIAQDTKLPSHLTIADFLSSTPNSENLYTVLEHFNFPYQDRHKTYQTLSPGERTRILLAKFTLDQVNVLLLDEPTNHLDIEAIEALEDFLINFPGSIILASHDRTLIEKVQPTTYINLANPTA